MHMPVRLTIAPAILVLKLEILWVYSHYIHTKVVKDVDCEGPGMTVCPALRKKGKLVLGPPARSHS